MMQHKEFITFLFITDCGKICSSGVLEDCSYCRCSDTFSGQIFSTKSLTLGSVSISPVNSPSTILFTTSLNGTFVLTDACSDQQYIFQKDGFLNLALHGDNIDGALQMDELRILLLVILT